MSRQRERERERERERKRETQGERDRQTDRQTDQETEECEKKEQDIRNSFLSYTTLTLSDKLTQIVH